MGSRVGSGPGLVLQDETASLQNEMRVPPHAWHMGQLGHEFRSAWEVYVWGRCPRPGRTMSPSWEDCVPILGGPDTSSLLASASHPLVQPARWSLGLKRHVSSGGWKHTRKSSRASEESRFPPGREEAGAGGGAPWRLGSGEAQRGSRGVQLGSRGIQRGSRGSSGAAGASSRATAARA